MEISCKAIKLDKNLTESIIVNNNIPFYYNNLKNANATDNEILYAVCIFDELLEFCSD